MTDALFVDFARDVVGPDLAALVPLLSSVSAISEHSQRMAWHQDRDSRAYTVVQIGHRDMGDATSRRDWCLAKRMIEVKWDREGWRTRTFKLARGFVELRPRETVIGVVSVSMEVANGAAARRAVRDMPELAVVYEALRPIEPYGERSLVEVMPGEISAFGSLHYRNQSATILERARAVVSGAQLEEDEGGFVARWGSVRMDAGSPTRHGGDRSRRSLWGSDRYAITVSVTKSLKVPRTS